MKTILRITRNTFILFCVLGLSLSNLPYDVLSSVSRQLSANRNVVDKIWLAQKNSNVVDRFIPFQKIADRLRIQDAYAAVGDAFIEYGQSTNAAPWTSFYTASSNSWGAGASTGVAGTANVGWTVSKESPTQDLTVLAAQSSTGKLDIFCRTGSTWTKDIANVTIGTTAATRRFDVEFEKTSGIPMVLYSTNTATTNELAYYRKTGAGCGAGSWTGPTTLNPTRITGIALWVELEARQTSGSNVMAAAFSDASATQGGILEAMVWDPGGAGWGTESPATAANGWSDSSIELQGTAGANAAKVFDLAFETNSGELFIAWGTSLGANGTNGWRYATCTGGTTSCTTWSGVLTPAGPLDDATNVACAPDPGSDAIACLAQGNAGSDLSAWTWTGAAVGATTGTSADATLLATAAGDMHVDIDWVVSGSQRMAVGVYAETTTGVRYIYYDTVGAAWRTNTTTSFTPTGAPATALQSVQVLKNPSNAAQLLTVLTDANSDLFSLRLNYNGAAGGATTALSTWNASTGSPIEATPGVSSITSQPFWFDWIKVAPAATVTATSTGTQTSLMDSGATGQNLTAAFRFQQSGGSADTITALTITDNASGTVNANTTLSNATIQYKTSDSGTCAYSGVTTAKTGATFNASEQAIFNSLTSNIPLTLSPNYTCVFLLVDLSNTGSYPAGGQTFEPQITSSADFTLSGGTNKAGAYPVALSGTTTVRPNATSISYAVGGDGGRSGDSATISGYGFGAPSAGANRADCTTATVDRGCVKFIVGGTTNVASGDITSWTNTSVVFTVNAVLASDGGASAVEIRAANQADTTPLTYYIYPNLSSPGYTATFSDGGYQDGIITITGDHLGSSGAASNISFNGVNPESVGAWTSTSISTVATPNTGADSGTITVTRASDSKASNASSTFYIYPQITSLNITEGQVGVTVNVTGNHFGSSQGGGSVAINGATAGGSLAWGVSSITGATVPLAGTITGNVVVTRNDTKTSNGSAFTILPQITSMINKVGLPANSAREFDASDTQDAGSPPLKDGEVRIMGDHFGSSAGTGEFLMIPGPTARASTPSSWADNQIILQVPTTIDDSLEYTGSIRLTRSGDSKQDSYSTFKVLPRITALNPNTGITGDDITIEGNHFCQNSGTCPTSPNRDTTDNNITFNGGALIVPDPSDVTGWTDTAVNVKVPTGAATGDVQVESDIDGVVNDSNTAISNTKPFTLGNAIPDDVLDDISFKQCSDSGCTSTITTGSTITANTVYFQMKLRVGTSGGTLCPQAELTAVGTAFDGVGGDVYTGTGSECQTSVAANTTYTKILAITSIADGAYHWRARVRHEKPTSTYYYSAAWTSFGSNTENPPTNPAATDFRIDSSGPVVSSVSVDTIGEFSATIHWSTDEDATANVEYRKSTSASAYFKAPKDLDTSTGVSPHAITITDASGTTAANLTCNQAYEFKIIAKDNQNNTTTCNGTTTGFCPSYSTFSTSACTNRIMRSVEFYAIQPSGADSQFSSPYTNPEISTANGNGSFDVYLEETSPIIKSVFVEITGVSSGSAALTLSAQVNAAPSKSFLLPVSTTPQPFKVLYQIPSANINVKNSGGGSANELQVSFSGPSSVSLTGAKVHVTYHYAP